MPSSLESRDVVIMLTLGMGAFGRTRQVLSRLQHDYNMITT